jgi:hypothetical protein
MTQVRRNTENPAQFTGFMSENERVLTFGETAQATYYLRNTPLDWIVGVIATMLRQQ